MCYDVLFHTYFLSQGYLTSRSSQSVSYSSSGPSQFSVFYIIDSYICRDELKSSDETQTVYVDGVEEVGATQ